MATALVNADRYYRVMAPDRPEEAARAFKNVAQVRPVGRFCHPLFARPSVLPSVLRDRCSDTPTAAPSLRQHASAYRGHSRVWHSAGMACTAQDQQPPVRLPHGCAGATCLSALRFPMRLLVCVQAAHRSVLCRLWMPQKQCSSLPRCGSEQSSDFHLAVALPGHAVESDGGPGGSSSSCSVRRSGGHIPDAPSPQPPGRPRPRAVAPLPCVDLWRILRAPAPSAQKPRMALGM